MLPLKKTKKIFWTVLVLVAVTAGLFAYAYSQVQGKISKAVDLQKEQALITQQKEQNQTIQQILEGTQKQRKELNKYFISQNGVASFINTVESLGADSGVAVEISSVNITDPSQKKQKGGDGEKNKSNKGDGLETLRLDLKAVGSWGNIFEFFTSLEGLPHISSTEDVMFEHKGEESDQGAWNANISLRVVKIKGKDGS